MKVPPIPASFFGSVLGLSGLGGSWRAAHDAWGLPVWPGEALYAAAGVVWLALVALYAAKWVNARAASIEEALHPVQCCFIGLVGVATMLVGAGALPHSRPLAIVLMAAGGLFTLGFAVWRTGGLWQGGRDPATTTPVLYLPTVAGSFVSAASLGALGYPDWGQAFFGGGLFSWLAIESVLIHRLLTADPLPPPLRPTLGIQLAPAPVGALAYLSVTQGPPDVLAHALLGYGVLQALVLIRLLSWIMKQPFAPSYWAFTFGATALASTALKLVARGDTGPAAAIAPVLFVAANLVVCYVSIRSTMLFLQSARRTPAAV
ncbi:dicarboxylate transporter/tellurite-resistance protein TehA [Methylopila sp. Yamaguchi]|uniref:dicarboxylate transporter/tellurite-resistance protein TehA n=1 Tax=Methylopila sp. Yamaguchi TaxID=1437817 RepID=UPI000CCC8FA2|nr:dicarboxylate transporter/tellurite-resistance protein TehA [Methylopila sp. Yamaguchi]